MALGRFSVSLTKAASGVFPGAVFVNLCIAAAALPASRSSAGLPRRSGGRSLSNLRVAAAALPASRNELAVAANKLQECGWAKTRRGERWAFFKRFPFFVPFKLRFYAIHGPPEGGSWAFFKQFPIFVPFLLISDPFFFKKKGTKIEKQVRNAH